LRLFQAVSEVCSLLVPPTWCILQLDISKHIEQLDRRFELHGILVRYIAGSNSCILFYEAERGSAADSSRSSGDDDNSAAQSAFFSGLSSLARPGVSIGSPVTRTIP
jgi:hypothetical protein